MRASFNFLLHKASYGLMLSLCGTLIVVGTAFAMDGHDHGNAKDPASATMDLANVHNHGSAKNQPPSDIPTPIKEIALPEGFSSAQSMAIDSTGRIWFTEKVGKKLAVYDPEKKEFATHSLPSSWGGTGFSNMTLGPDGEIWFTVTRWIEGEKAPNILGRFTPADGYFTKYTLPHNSIPEELVVDANGTIWFVTSNKNNLYRVDSKTFALKGYPIPTANGNPKSLAVDQKGHVWFVESTANKIGEFIPEQEVFYEHELLTQFANPGKISIDKHGRIWFVEITTNRLGMFSPELKRFSEAIIPTPGSAPVALANDDNGNVWFLEYKGNKVGVFNSETAIFHEYDIPSFGSLPADMAIDHKRSLLWFTQSATEAKRLGMISINEVLAEINKQNNAPPPPSAEKASNEDMTKWLPLLAVIIAIAMLGMWLIRKLR
jgi:streptogramin lyase